MTLIRLTLFSLLFAASAGLIAQDKPLPPPRDFKPETRRAADVLPALHLPEYVITGSDVASFTDDRKGGIGEPDARSLTSRAGRGVREPRFMGTSPTRLPLGLTALQGIQNVAGLRIGYGTFYTPSVEAWYADRFENGDIAVDGDFEQSRGHVRLADYKHAQLRASGGVYLPRDIHPLFAASRLEGDFEIQGKRYGLYADKLQAQIPPLDFQRSGERLLLRGGVVSRKNTVFDHELSMFFASSSLEEHMSVRDTLPLETYQQVEQRFGVDFASRHEVYGIPVRTNAQLHFSGLKHNADDASSPLYLLTGASGRFGFSDNLWLDGGLNMIVHRGSNQAANVRLYPQVRLSLRLHDDYTGWVAFEPEVRERTFDEFRRLNPFLMIASELRHTDVPILFSSGIAFDNRRFTSGRIFLEYLSTSSWPRFDLLPDPVRQQWELRYGAWTSIFSVQAELHHRFSKRTRIQLNAVVRSSKDDELDDAVPYLPNLEVRTMVAHDFPFGLSVQAHAQLAGEQFTQEGDIPAWMLVGLEMEYRLLRNIALFLRFSNMLDHDYQRWRGYRERPFFMMGGVTIRM